MTYLKRVFRAVQLGRSLCSAPARPASTYEGDGKTAAQVINKDMSYLMVDAFSVVGFRLNSGIRIIGPMILFPRTFLSWNIAGVAHVSEESLSIFKLLSPKIDILVFGYGDANTLPRSVELKVLDFSKRHNIGVEILTTENAVSTFNYLNHEKRFVAGAFIPPKTVKIYDDSDLAGVNKRQDLLDAQ